MVAAVPRQDHSGEAKKGALGDSHSRSAPPRSASQPEDTGGRMPVVTRRPKPRPVPEGNPADVSPAPAVTPPTPKPTTAPELPKPPKPPETPKPPEAPKLPEPPKLPKPKPPKPPEPPKEPKAPKA
jgi:hypothetical protein